MEIEFKDFYDLLIDNLESYVEDYDTFIDYGPRLYKLLCDCLNEEIINGDLRINISAAIAYYVVPMDVIPEQIYGPYGYIDDNYISVYVLGKVANTLGYDFLQHIWDGDDDVESIIKLCYRESVKRLNNNQIEEILKYVGIIR